MKMKRKNNAGRKPAGEKQRVPQSYGGKLWFMVGGAGLIIFAALFIYLWTGPFGDKAVVAEVNREPVTAQEFRREILLKRGEVIAYFRTQYGVEAGAGFWTKSYGGEVPSEVVKNKALNEVIKIKVQLLLAQKAGLIEDISYRTILASMKNENKRRKEAIANHQVIFGLAEFSEQTYFDYLLSDLDTKLKSRLAEEWRITDEELRNYYETVKDVYYVDANADKDPKNKGKSYISFEKAKQYLGPRYFDIKYNEYINQLAETAAVRIHQNVYQRIQTDR